MTPVSAAPSTDAEWREYLLIARRHANGLAYKYNSRDADELYGRLYEIALVSAQNFDPTRGCRFDSWTYAKLEYELKSERCEAAELAKEFCCTGFIDSDDSVLVAPDEYDETRLGIDLTDLTCPSGLTVGVRKWLWASQGNATAAEMAARLGVTERRVNQMLDEVLGGLERAKAAGQGDLFAEGEL
jgi:hypothetical protein